MNNPNTPEIIPYVTILHGEIRTTSLKIAEHFGKNHKDVLRAIRNLDRSTVFTERNFAPSDYKDASGKLNLMYEMTRDGFTLLVMGFNGKEAIKWKEAYITAFNAMERALRAEPLTPEQIYLNLAKELRTALPGLNITNQAVLLSKDAGNRNFSGETRDQCQYFRKMDAYGLPGIIVKDKKPYRIWFDWLTQGRDHAEDITESVYEALRNHCRGRGLKGVLRPGYRKKTEPFQIRGCFEEITGFKTSEEAQILAKNLGNIVSSLLAAKLPLSINSDSQRVLLGRPL